MKQPRTLLDKVAAFSKHGPAQQERIKDGLGARLELSAAGTIRASEFANLETRVCRKFAKWFSQDMNEHPDLAGKMHPRRTLVQCKTGSVWLGDTELSNPPTKQYTISLVTAGFEFVTINA
jgi:hypothetical protein